jgi:hypothetical protein
MNNLLELEFGTPPGNHKNPSQDNHRSRPQTITNTCRTSTAAPSHLGGGNHQEKQEIPQQINPSSATKCKTMINALESLNLTQESQLNARK